MNESQISLLELSSFWLLFNLDVIFDKINLIDKIGTCDFTKSKKIHIFCELKSTLNQNGYRLKLSVSNYFFKITGITLLYGGHVT
jgi:hypothetical protein